MKVFDSYMFKHLSIATVLTGATLALVILLTQSLNFMELIMSSGASGTAFWTLVLLAMPRFLEVILPVALMASMVFTYNRMTMDSELTVMRSLGATPLNLARPALMLATVVTICLWIITGWLSPLSQSNMNYLRTVIKAQVSQLMFREGVFTTAGKGLTFFVREKNDAGELHGIVIHDARDKDKPPVTIMAKRGGLLMSPQGQKVIVYDGSRQDMNAQTGTLSRLDFTRYTIDIPVESGTPRQRWREPEERSFVELFHLDLNDARDVKNRQSFVTEIHRRIVSPLIALSFAAIGLAFLLLGPVDRRGQSWRIALCALATIAIEGGYIGAFNVARQELWGIGLMYVLILLPLGAGLFALSGGLEKFRNRKLLRGLP